MRYNFIKCTSVLILLSVTVMSFTTNKSKGKSLNGNSITEKTSEQVAMVYPNPESGILNLFCSTSLQSPLNIKVVNIKGNTIKTIQSLKAEGAENHKYVQFTTSGIIKGEYNIIVSDASGKTFSRMIYLQK